MLRRKRAGKDTISRLSDFHPGDLLPLWAFAEICGVGAQTARRWVHAGKVEVVELPGMNRPSFLVPYEVVEKILTPKRVGEKIS